jgi:hypothetical protein
VWLVSNEYFLLGIIENPPEEVMWGCDLTPLYDETGSRLMSFTAFLPLGMRLAGAPKFTLRGESFPWSWSNCVKIGVSIDH